MALTGQTCLATIAKLSVKRYLVVVRGNVTINNNKMEVNMTNKKKSESKVVAYLKKLYSNTVKTIKGFFGSMVKEIKEMCAFYRKLAKPITQPIMSFVSKKWEKAPMWMKKVVALFKPFIKTFGGLIELALNVYVFIPIIYSILLVVMIILSLIRVGYQFIEDAKAALENTASSAEACPKGAQ